jgi:hypothetical protein
MRGRVESLPTKLKDSSFPRTEVLSLLSLGKTEQDDTLFELQI